MLEENFVLPENFENEIIFIGTDMKNDGLKCRNRYRRDKAWVGGDYVEVGKLTVRYACTNDIKPSKYKYWKFSIPENNVKMANRIGRCRATLFVSTSGCILHEVSNCEYREASGMNCVCKMNDDIFTFYYWDIVMALNVWLRRIEIVVNNPIVDLELLSK